MASSLPVMSFYCGSCYLGNSSLYKLTRFGKGKKQDSFYSAAFLELEITWAFIFLSKILFCTISQDLKDYVRQAGDVTYGDAHRPVKGEGYVEQLSGF